MRDIDTYVNYRYYHFEGCFMAAHDAMRLVELFHLLFLDVFGRKIDKRFYALKGGSNLRFFLRSFRYSEDMDIPRCADGADEAIALIRTHHSLWQKRRADSHAQP